MDESPTDTDSDSEENSTHTTDERTIDRRSVLAAASGAMATGLAGCNNVLSQERTYRASWVSLATGERPPGVSFASDDEITTQRTVDAGPTTIEATIVSHTARYERRRGNAAPFLQESSVGLVSTPAAREAGQTLNPAGKRPLEELLAGDVGREFLRNLDVEPNWQDGPRRLRETTDQLLGTETTIETYSGTTTNDEFVLLNATRVIVDGDVVLAGNAYTRSLDQADRSDEVDSETVDRAIEAFRPLFPLVVRRREGEGPTPTPTTADPAEFPPGRIPMAEVPREIKQRVARLLEEDEGSPVTWDEPPSLGAYAHEVGRPDVDGVAYYELAVDPQGFVVCATGEHDLPIAHANTDGETMGVSLEQRGGRELGRLVWIDRLRYVAEDTDGNRMAARGNEVPKLEGLDALVDAAEGRPIHTVYGPEEDVEGVSDDEVGEEYQPQRLVGENADFEPPEEFSFARWESHEELLANYEDIYGPLLEALREDASEAWSREAQRSAELEVERTHREPLLDDADLEALDGDAADAVDVTRRSREETHDVLELTPTEDATPGTSLRVALGDGTERVYRITDLTRDSPESDAISWVDQANFNPPGSGPKYWAGGFSIQPKYFQFTHGKCAVGCGPVAWAILFGWGDRQADSGTFNGVWNGRYGLYLQNGGRWRNGARDAVAPKGMNSGVRNIIKELNSHVNVFCMFNSGATGPWDMDKARKYLRGRTYAKIEVHASVTPIISAYLNARDSITGAAPNKRATPVVVGEGFLSHYPVAYAFWRRGNRFRDLYKVNNGWGGHGRVKNKATEWIPARTWFSGELDPY